MRFAVVDGNLWLTPDASSMYGARLDHEPFFWNSKEEAEAVAKQHRARNRMGSAFHHSPVLVPEQLVSRELAKTRRGRA